ncbi:MAG TPA: AtpZ/AtpI family protein, partial [Caulobacteraceae bacterium]|nr:AtpZ/AtpI family protein [Caulobacteraceae bacterium]
GLGWLVDHFAHTSPWGLVTGLAIGVTFSVYGAVRTASRISARAEAKAVSSVPPAGDEEDE